MNNSVDNKCEPISKDEESGIDEELESMADFADAISWKHSVDTIDTIVCNKNNELMIYFTLYKFH